MRVIRWKNAVTGVESLNITATGIYFPVGKTDSSFIARYSMVSAGQTASVERVSSPNGSRVGSPAINVSGTTEVVVNERRGLSTGIIVTAISGTLISVLDDNTPITNFPDAGLGRFPAKEDADAYVYSSTVPQGIPAIISGALYSWSGSTWVAVGGSAAKYSIPLLRFGPNRYIPSENVGGNIIDNSYLDNSGATQSAGVYFVSTFIPVTPGEYLSIAAADAGFALLGGYYNSGNFVSSISASWDVISGYYLVPAGVTHLRLNASKTATYTGMKFVRKVLTYASSLAASIASVCALGDSITYGSGTTKRWWEIACVDRLGASVATNLGINGSTVAYSVGYNPMSRRLSSLVESDVMTFMGGSNDRSQNIALGVISDTTDSTFYGALYVIAKYMSENFPFSRIIWCTMYKTSTGITANSNGATIMDFNTAIRTVANLWGFELCDFELKVPNMSKYPWSRILMHDNTHVSQGGSEIMGNVAFQSIISGM